MTPLCILFSCSFYLTLALFPFNDEAIYLDWEWRKFIVAFFLSPSAILQNFGMKNQYNMGIDDLLLT